MSNQVFEKKILIHLTIAFLLLGCGQLIAQKLNQQYEFKHLNAEDGLSQGNINTILKDSKGYMWFGTYDGLNKYDGYSFTVYKNNPEDSTSISDSFIRELMEDETGYLWIAHASGVDRYNRETNEFSDINYDLDYSDKTENRAVESICIDHIGRLWAGTLNRGVFIVTDKNNPEKLKSEPFGSVIEDAKALEGIRVYKIFQDSQERIWMGVQSDVIYVYHHEKNELMPIGMKDKKGSNYNIWSISEDQYGNIWLGGDGGLTKVSYNLSEIKNFPHDPKDPGTISRGTIKAVYHDNYHRMWVGTQSGLNLYDEDSDTFSSLTHDDFDETTLSHSEVWSIYQDEEDVMWLGTFTAGINVHHPTFSMFGTMRYNPSDPKGLGGPNVTSFYQDKKGNLWIGLDHDGLDYYDMKSNTYIHFKSGDANSNTISGNSIMTIAEDRHGDLWFGTYNDGISRYNPKTRRWKRYYADKGNDRALQSNIVYDIIEDSDGELWFATIQGGLSKYDRKKDQFVTYGEDLDDPNALSNDHLWSLLEDRKGEIWIGTSHGVNVFYKKTGKFKRYLPDPDDPESIGDYSTQTLFKDSKGRIWIGQGSGVCVYNRNNDSFKCYSEIDGLSNNIVLGIQEDRRGNIWISSFNGLSMLNPVTEEIKAYHEGLQGSQFNYESCLRLTDGRLVFGGTQGYNLFNPELVQDNERLPRVSITDFQVFYESVPVLINETALKPNIDRIKPISLDYRQSVFSFEFSSLNYIDPLQNTYAFMLEGFEKDWTYTTPDRRFASYTNIPEGSYTFKVKASNNDGVWGKEGAEVSIVIDPPWYRAQWFRYFAFLLIITATYALYKLRVRMLQRQKTVLEHKVNKRTLEVNLQKQELERQAEMLKSYNQDILNKNSMLEDLHRQKDGMVGIVAHDLRSPLNHIKSFIDLLPLVGPLNDDQKLQVDHMKRLIEQGNMLISDLLYVNGIKQFDIALNSKKFDMVPFINDFLISYNQELERKKQQLDIDIVPKSLRLNTDEDVLRRVMENIFSNAIKFSELGKTIYLKLSEDKSHAIVSIRDEGPGINDSELPKLFEMFQRLSAKPTGGEHSTGLGLSIVKALVQKLGGKIEVKSKVGEGTEFIVYIPKELSAVAKETV